MSVTTHSSYTRQSKQLAGLQAASHGQGSVLKGRYSKDNVGVFSIRIGFWGIVYYNYNKETPKPYSNFYGPCST